MDWASLLRAGRWEEALADADPVERALLLRRLGREEEALRVPLPEGPGGLRVLASLAADEGDHARACALLARAAARSAEVGDRLGEARALIEGGEAAANAGAMVRAEEGFMRALALAEGDVTVDALNGLAAVMRYTGRLEDAEDTHARATALARALDYPLGEHVGLRGLGAVALARGDAETTRERCERALAIAEALGFRDGVSWCCVGLGEAARHTGDLDAAERWYRAALRPGLSGTKRVAVLANLALVAQRRGDLRASRVLLEEALGYAEGPSGIGWRAVLHGTIVACCEAADDEAAWVDHYTRAVALLAETGEVEADLGTSLDLAGALAEAKGALGRATRARALALAQWEALGREAEAGADRATLDRLAAAGAPIPLGPFDLVERIGAGAVGEVWRGAHHALGTPVAVKVLAAASARLPQRQAAFRAEVRSVAALDHPHVVAVLDHGLVDAAAARLSGGRLVAKSPFLVMELAEGGTLDAWCGRLAWDTCRDALLQLLDGLAHAHARGVVHRDLKPANVLVDTVSPLAVRISDFGLSHAVGEVAGTPETMAPEQFVRGAAHGPWTDLYAVGCVATALVSGRWPYDAADLAGWRRAHLAGVPAPLAPAIAVPPGLEAWIARLLRKDPAERFRNAADAAFALRRLGPPTRPPAVAAPRPRASVSNATMTGDDLDADALPVEVGSPAIAPCPVEPAPVPDDPGAVAGGRWWLPGAGLGLLALRAPPWVGRARERAALWEALLEVRRTGRAKVVTLSGEPGVGRTRLLTWLAERARETGAAEVVGDPAVATGPALLCVDAGEPLPPIPPGAPVLAVVAGEGGLAVPPLSDAEIEGLARDHLGLGPELAGRLARAAAGRPQLVVQVVGDWLARGQLVAGEHGFLLRGGVEPAIPGDLGEAWRARFAPFRAGPALAIAARAPLVDDAAWRAACGAEGVEVPAGLVERLIDAGLAAAAPGGWRFTSASARAALYAG
ncbi:MAG: protein kinase domain-containing protein [Myxococcota bacterium]